ncbi:ArdC-like ssDNA-binding domain-containing protein [Chromobacterium subtsugae]|uniref:ArdC-like ssDNA-binding domain-containing protein n=1 Tax=Chromobacterium subtsugae TaxID=251747 RepID=UPI00064147B4|nr:ArdC-like ssDNA-binding domain-containing protein [Chromobacterium subtsugae]
MMDRHPHGRRAYAQEAAQRIHEQVAALGAEHVFAAPLAGARHFNPLTGTVYQGINHLLLQSALPAASSDPRWLSYKQIQSLGLGLAPGARAGLLLFARPMQALTGPAGPALKGCSVFNGAQILGLPPLSAHPAAAHAGGGKLQQLVGAILSELGLREESGGAAAVYDPAGEIIRVPQAGYFRNMREYNAARLRKAAQWAAQHEKRPRAAKRRPRHHGPDDPLEELWAHIVSALLMGMIGFGAAMPAEGRQLGGAIPLLQRIGEIDFMEWFHGAHQVEQVLGWLGQLSPTLARLMEIERQFVRGNLLEGGDTSVPQAQPSAATPEAQIAGGQLADARETEREMAREARRHALLMDVALLTAPELAHQLASHFGAQQVLAETDAAIHEKFQHWAQGAVMGGMFDGAAAKARELFGVFLRECGEEVGHLLEKDGESQRQARMAAAIEMPSAGSAGKIAVIGGAEPAAPAREISIQPFRDGKGGWLKVGHQDVIELGLVRQIADDDSRMTPSAVYLSFREDAPHCDAQRLMDAVDAAGWKIQFQQYVESKDSQIRSYASYFAPLVGYMPKIGDKLKLVEGVASISSKSGSGGWVVSFDDAGKQRALSSGRFYDFIESVIEGDFLSPPAAGKPERAAAPQPKAGRPALDDAALGF